MIYLWSLEVMAQCCYVFKVMLMNSDFQAALHALTFSVGLQNRRREGNTVIPYHTYASDLQKIL